MADIRFMEAKGGVISARVNVNLLNSTFLPQHIFEFQNEIYNAEEIVKSLNASAKTENERKDYLRCVAVLKWGKTCHGSVKNITLENDKEGKHMQIEFIFYDVNFLIEFNKDFEFFVENAII